MKYRPTGVCSKEIEFESIVLKEKPSVPQEKIDPPHQMS